MTIPSDSNVTGHLARLRAATEKWWSQVIFYLVLVVVFFVIDQLLIHDHYRYSPGSIFNWVFLVGEWIPGLSNLIVIAVIIRGPVFWAYLIITAVSTYCFTLPYSYVTGMDDLGVAVGWMADWFWGGVIGLLINLVVRGR